MGGVVALVGIKNLRFCASVGVHHGVHQPDPSSVICLATLVVQFCKSLISGEASSACSIYLELRKRSYSQNLGSRP